MTPDDKKPQMRVSDWGEADAPSPPVPPATALRPTRPGKPAPAGDEAEPEGFDLPVDPFRLLGGLWQRRYGLIMGGFAGAVLATAVGFLRTETRYQVSAQLIEREVPDSFRAGEIGEAFKPRTLSTATLLGLAGSNNVLSRVAERADPPVSLSLLRRSTAVAEQRGTDYLFLTVSGYDSAAATVTLANLWSEEVVDYTRDMQSRESREIRQYLQQELDSNQADLERVGGGMLEYTRREGLVNIDKQIDAQLRSIGDLDLRYESARLEIDATKVKLRGLETELRRQSPLADELKEARANLDQIRNRYTDTNPIALEAAERVTAIEARLDLDRETPNDDLSRYAGTFLGNTLYLQILQLRSQEEAVSNSLAELKSLRDQARAELRELPAKEMGIAQLTRNRSSLESTRNLLLSRLREAELFEERAPGYYQVFSPATVESVITRGKPIKVAVYGLLGLFAGGGLAFVGALGLELLDNRLRTGREAAKAWGAPLLASLPATPPADPETLRDTQHQLWSRWLGSATTATPYQVIWAPLPDASEDMLWSGLLGEARRLLPSLLVIDMGESTSALPVLSTLPAVSLDAATQGPRSLQRVALPGEALSIDEAHDVARRIQHIAASGRPVWIRFIGHVREPLSTLAQIGAPGLIVVPAERGSIPFWREQAARYRATVGRVGGVVMVGETPWHQR